MVDSHIRCPGPEVLAAYIDRGLSLAEQARVNRHLASCPQCISLVAGVVRTVADVPEFTPHVAVAVETASRVTRRTLVGVLAVAAAVFMVLFSPSLLRSWLDRDTGLVNLVGVGEQRSVLGRLTGGFPHAPLGVPSAGGQGGRAAETDRILLTAAKIRESFGERDTPARLHDLGISQLMAGRHDDAIESLLAASREQPANARYLNDVAAAQLERARRGLRPDDLPRALASADRARRLDSSLNEAWFNRALAATALSLRDQAKVAWADYLARDTSSAWSAEARTRLEELSQPTPAAAWAALEQKLGGAIDAPLADEAVRVQTTEARNYLEHTLLPDWAMAVESGKDTSRELERVRVMADSLARVAGDALYADAVAAIDRANARGGTAVAGLATAHRHYAEAAAVVAEDRFADAALLLAGARAELSAADSPYAHRAALDLGAVAYFGGRADEATRLLLPLRDTARAASYANIAARVAWQQGLIAIGQGRLGAAQAFYEETLSAFERMGDAEQAAFAHHLLAALHSYLGDHSTEWRHRLEAFEGLEISRSPRVRHSILSATAGSLRIDNPEAALIVQDAVLDNARAWARVSAVAEGLSQRAAILFQLGRSSDAEQDLNAARQALAAVPDQQFRSRIEVALLSTESDVSRLTSPQASAAAATRAIEIVERRRDRLRLAQLNLRLAKANVVWGRLDEAERALAKGIDTFNEERASLSDEGRIATHDEAWQLFETALQLAVRKRDYPRAFALAEQARTSSLAESRSPSAGRSLQQVQDRLGADEAILTLSQFDDELAVWVIRREGTFVATRPLTRRDAQQLVARQLDEIRYEAAEPDASADLYNQIVRPVASRLRGLARVAVVPDATYAGASFSALWDRSSRRFLVESVHISMTPSASAFVATGGDRTAPRGRPLILAGPGDRAGDEARAMATAYDAPELLTGDAVTRSRFFSTTANRAVVHIAAPTVENRAYPLLSRVLLTDEPGRQYSGVITGYDIAARSMAGTRLVVLEETKVSAQTEGTPSLTRAFLAAGVPAVLTTLPGADQAATRELMVGFHRLMSSGITAEDALATLQRNVLKSNGHRLGAWSALVLYGSER